MRNPAMTSLVTPSPRLENAERPAERHTPTAPPIPREKPARLVSLDAYRGAIMLFMASGGLALPAVARHFPDSPIWRFLGFNTDHVPWVGCSLWDLIQPSFMFMVGVAMPYSIASRRVRGDSETKIFAHVLYRAVFLVLLAIFLTSNWSKQTDFVFTNVLAQIGLGYALLYFLLGRGLTVQLAALASILIGYWLLFLLWPLPASGFDYHSVGWKDDWQGLPGWFAALGQEHQRGGGLRCLVPQSVSARQGVRLQQGRLSNAQLRAVAGHHDPRPDGRRDAADAEKQVAQARLAACGRRACA